MKSIPNCISIARIVLALALLGTRPLGAAFFALYAACGLSDALDGYLARKTGAVSKLGGDLDTAGDLVLVAVLLAVLYPVIRPTAAILLWIAAIAAVKAASLLIVFLRFKTFEILHTYASKATGFALFVFPVLLARFPADVLMASVCALATAAAIEELLIHLSSRELKIDRKSIFTR